MMFDCTQRRIITVFINKVRCLKDYRGFGK